MKNLPIGVYTITISAPNFSDLRVNQVLVQSGKNNSLGGQTMKVPYVEQYSLGLEGEFLSRFAFDTRYVGNHGLGNFQTINGNPVISSTPASLLPSGVTLCSAAGAAAGAGSGATGRIDCNFTNLRVRGNGAWSIYNGWQN